jgi:malonate transporter
MNALLTIILPLFAIIGCGYAAGRVKLLGEAATEALNAFVYYFALPALFFRAMAVTPLQSMTDVSFIGAFLLGMAIAFSLSWLVARLIFRTPAPERVMHAFAAVYSNIGFVGIPFFTAAFGQDSTFPVIFTVLVQMMLLFIPITVAVELMTPDGNRSVGAVMLGAARNPFFIASAAGLLLNLTNLGIPEPVDAFLKLMSGAAVPCALFALGLFLVGTSITRGFFEVCAITVAKLAIYPAITWACAVYVFDLPAESVRNLVLISAFPVGALSFVMAQKLGVYVQRAAAAILVSTVASMLTLWALAVYYGLG